MAGFDLSKVKKLENNVNYDLSDSEIKFLLSLLSDNYFQGKNLELLYNVVLKLQNQYIKIVRENGKME